ncbi:nuclear body protein SP140-like protein isoform X2 [Sturnira hondurensis]|uniref:nuclear body protein SP140-like protein isoform X2 n=1 Tax=Sturnira hondurensis TaxID=192404 RepID=UPI0018797AA6|nr:nuclear body protein SP140-like protein isoform X2 [Sturnira hondurensis]
MASTGSNLRTRMSKEDYKLMCDIAVKHFKEHKAEISDAIKASYPFLETLRDRKLITNEMYKESIKTCEDPSTVPKVVYKVLDNMKRNHVLPLLETLFSKFIMENYPDLNGICEGFRDAILKKIFHEASFGNESAENSNTQLRLEQGTGENPYQFLSWLFPDQSNRTVTSSEDSVERRDREQPPKASTSALKRKPESMNLSKSSTSGNRPCKRVRNPEVSLGFNAKEKLPEARSSAVRSGADQEGFMDLGNRSALQTPKKRRRARQQPCVSVNFRAQILHVDCGEMCGLLIKRKLERGATRKCIRTEDGNWFTPREFEVRGGYEKASNWKTSLTCGGKTLKHLMELGCLRSPPTTREIKKKEQNSDKCKICQDGQKLFRCENCQSFFHGDCHLPPVNTKRNGWNCTFCTIENSSQSLQRYRESEVLEKQMEPWRKLKCEFLLLKVYHHLESNIFPNIPHGNYVTKASQYLGKLRKLDIIKKKLIKENYCKVKDFKEDMDKFFQDPRHEKLHLNQEEFMKNFKEVFAIQETN